jgi:hypothetical protein
MPSVQQHACRCEAGFMSLPAADARWRGIGRGAIGKRTCLMGRLRDGRSDGAP